MKKFNIIDVLIVVLIAVIAAGGIFAVKQLTKEKDTETKIIVLEIREQKESFCDVVKIGDTVYDGTDNKELGKVKDFEIKQAEKDGKSTVDGTVKHSEVPDRFDILLDIEASKNTDVQVGKQMWIETSAYKASGYVLGVTEE